MVLCLRQLPSLDDIAKAAGFGEFAEITGDELAAYRPAAPPEELRAWRFHDSGAEFILTAIKTKPDERFRAATPEFARSTNFACSLASAASEPPAAVLAALVRLLGRAPSETSVEGTMQVHAWRERTDKHLSLVHYYVPAEGSGRSILSASTFVRN